MANSLLQKKLRTLSEKYAFYEENEKTLVGFSGGADSTALLHILVEFLGKKRIVAFHLDHMLRGAESQRDEEFCRAFCHANDITFVSKQINIREYGETAIEETARRLRYEAFEEVATAYGCTTVSLAHHAGDNLETMLFHLCRGTGLTGLCGIPPKRPLGALTVVRPLLDCTKEEIFTYLQEHSLSYVTDSTNADTDYTRNFIRHEILPKLSDIHPNAAENARRTADILRETDAHLKEEAQALLANTDEASSPIEMLRSLPPSLRHEVLQTLYGRAGGSSLSAVQSEAVSALILHEKTNKKVSLTGNITALLDGKMLRFLREKEEKSTVLTETFPLKMGKNTPLDGTFVYLGAPSDDFFEVKKDEILFTATARIPFASLPTLHLRPRKNGESYRFGGMTRSLKKLLSGEDSRTKARPLLCDEDGILWHPNFKIADRADAEDGVDILYMEIK